MDLLYNRIVLYNRTIVAFGVFDIIYFRHALKALDIDRFACEYAVKMKYELKFFL